MPVVVLTSATPFVVPVPPGGSPTGSPTAPVTCEYRDLVKSDSPEFYYRLAEPQVSSPPPTAAPPVDEMGNHNASTLSGENIILQTPSLLSGPTNICPDFSFSTTINSPTNSPGGLTVPHTPILDLTFDSFTLEGWLGNWDGEFDPSGVSGYAVLLSKQRTGLDFPSYALGVTFTTGTARMHLSTANNGPSHNIIFGTSDVRDSANHYLTGTFDRTDFRMRLYVDGVMEAVGSTLAAGPFPNPAASVTSGYQQTGTVGGDELITGAYDEMALYRLALSPAQVGAHYLAGGKTTSSYEDEVLADNPIAYWRFDDAIGATTAIEEIGAPSSPNDGTYVNSPLLHNPPIIREAGTTSVDLNGTNQYVNMNTNLDPSGDFTWECWFRTTDTVFRLMDTRGTGGFGTIKGVQISVTDGATWGNTAIDNGVGGQTITFGSVSYTQGDGLPHQMVLTWDDSTGTARFYLDGELKSTQTNAAMIGANLATALPFRVGAASNSGTTHNLDGSIDEVAIYGTVLSSRRILAHYVAGIMPHESVALTVAPLSYSSTVLSDNPVGYWRLGDSSGPTATDSSGNGNDGTYSAISSFSQTAVAQNTGGDTAVNTGATGYFQIPNGLFAQNGPRDKGTIEFWITPSFNTGDSQDRVFFGGGLGANQDFVRFQHFTDNNYYCGWVGNPPDERIIISQTVAPMSSGQDYHWVYTWDQVAQRQVLYQNGRQVGIRNGSFTIYTSGANTFRFASNETIATGRCPGIWDECAIYTKVLTPAEVLEHYYAGTT